MSSGGLAIRRALQDPLPPCLNSDGALYMDKDGHSVEPHPQTLDRLMQEAIVLSDEEAVERRWRVDCN